MVDVIKIGQKQVIMKNPMEVYITNLVADTDSQEGVLAASLRFTIIGNFKNISEDWQTVTPTNTNSHTANRRTSQEASSFHRLES